MQSPKHCNESREHTRGAQRDERQRQRSERSLLDGDTVAVERPRPRRLRGTNACNTTNRQREPKRRQCGTAHNVP
jgi:endonuclease YncB( thermonuclease family)